MIGGAFLFFFDPNRYGFYPYCTFYRATGLLCPGCGSLRALHHLLHGDVAEAVHFNVVLVSSLPFLGLYAGRMLLNRWRGKSSILTPRPNWLWAGLVVLVVFGFLRNLPFAKAAWLAP
jgi:hypothetical protein